MHSQVLERFVPIRSGEWRITLLLFLHGMLAVGAFLTGRSVRDALYLAHAGQAALPQMYVFTSLTLVAVGLAYAKVTKQVRASGMAVGTAALFSVLFALAFVLEESTKAAWIYPTLYLMVEVMGGLCLTQFWSLANELFDAREAKRLYGLIGAGGTLANVLVGITGAKLASRYGASALLLLCSFQLLLASAVCAFAGRFGRKTIRPSAPQKARSTGLVRLFSQSHLRTVAALAAVTSFATALVDFEFKVTAAQHLSKDALAAFFSYFYAATGGLALALQIFGTSRLLNRFGVVGALIVLPLTLLLGNLSVALFPVLLFATMAKGADTLFRYTLNDATTQILYLPVSSQMRAAAKAFIDGVLKPTAMGAAGLTLLLYRTVAGDLLPPLALLGALACLTWGGLVLKLRSQYIRSLQDNLRRRRLDIDSARYRVNDASTSQILTRALRSQHPKEVLNALELLPQLRNHEADLEVEALLQHPLPEIRVAALDYFAQAGSLRHTRAVLSALEDADPDVRAHAVQSFSSLLKDKAVGKVRPFLSDTSPVVRRAALVGMIQHGGLEGLVDAAGALKSLLSSPSAVLRCHAAAAIGSSGQKNFYRLLLDLLNDPDPRVRTEAMRAAAQLKSPELILPLLAQAQRFDAAREVADALSAYGAAALPALGKVLGNSHEPMGLRRVAIRTLGRLGTPDAVAKLCDQLDHSDEAFRSQLFRALARCVKGSRLPVEPKRIERALDRELSAAWATVQTLENLGLEATGAPALLESALEEKRARTVERIFLLLSAQYPQEDLDRVHGDLRGKAHPGSRERANAVELLDNLLPLEIRRRLLPLLEGGARAAQLRAVADSVPLTPMGKEEQLIALCADSDPWVRACALHVAALSRISEAASSALAAVEDERWFVREMGLRAAATLAPERAKEILHRGLEDDVAPVRAAAQLLQVA